jgi:NADH-quinone oxidoreductase subunit M
MLLASIILFLLLGSFRPGLRAVPRCRWTSLGSRWATWRWYVGLFAGNLRADSGLGEMAALRGFALDQALRHPLYRAGRISLVLVLLTAFLTVLCVLVSWKQITTRVGAFHFFLMIMETGILGVFLANDLFLFYLFWEVQLIPMFFLIGVWGHENRVYATIKFILYTIAGSLLMLAALIGLYILHGTQTGQYTFSLSQLISTRLPLATEKWLFAAFLLAFAIKVPLVPVHSWLPDAHTEAPTAGSVILAGLLLKTGAYALLRFAFPLFPTAARMAVPLLLGLALVGLFYAAWIALAQKDLKRLVAYSSISHMGSWSWAPRPGFLTLSGAVLQMVNHGLTTSALFILVGMLDERVHSREMENFGGLWSKMPVFSAFFLFFCMASLGLPGLNNFVGEILILIGTFSSWPWVAGLGFAGLLFTVIFMLWVVQRTLFGETRDPHIRGQAVLDVTGREAAILVPLAAAVLFIGLFRPILALLRSPSQG